MYKIFSLAQANELIPEVDRKLRDMQDIASDLNTLHTFLNTAKPRGIKALNALQESRFLVEMLEAYGLELHAMGAHIKDLEQGHIVFPSQVGAEVVALCWEQGDEAIRYYQRVNHDKKYSLEPTTSTKTMNAETMDTEAMDTEAMDAEAMDKEVMDTEVMDTEAMDGHGGYGHGGYGRRSYG